MKNKSKKEIGSSVYEVVDFICDVLIGLSVSVILLTLICSAGKTVFENPEYKSNEAVLSPTEKITTITTAITPTEMTSARPTTTVYTTTTQVIPIGIEEPKNDVSECSNEVDKIPEVIEIVTEETFEENSEMTLLGEMRITGYVATGNPTSSGDMPYVGGVALSRDYGIPFGSTVYIENLGYYTVNDTGCAYGVVDVFCNTVEECYALTPYSNVYLIN